MTGSRIGRPSLIGLATSAVVLSACTGGAMSLPGPADSPDPRPPQDEVATADGEGHGSGRSRHGGQGHGHEHGGGHRFTDAETWAPRFEDPTRDEWQRPGVVIAALDLERSDLVADIGAATGYFPVRLARAVPEGRVWGVDIEPDMVRYLNDRARQESLDNLYAVLGTATDPLIPEPVDVVLMVNTYHHIESRPDYFRRLGARLRPGGRLAIVDFRMGDLPVGPPDSAKIPPEQVRRELESAGYRLAVDDSGALPHQFILIFEVEAEIVPDAGM